MTNLQTRVEYVKWCLETREGKEAVATRVRPGTYVCTCVRGRLMCVFVFVDDGAGGGGDGGADAHDCVEGK